jgi:hypothetical protein
MWYAPKIAAVQSSVMKCIENSFIPVDTATVFVLELRMHGITMQKQHQKTHVKSLIKWRPLDELF